MKKLSSRFSCQRFTNNLENKVIKKAYPALNEWQQEVSKFKCSNKKDNRKLEISSILN